ncbi:hypothetical protein [Flagellimonas crocea]|uniref:hypothetical protein n=1 Tax=Flagellimonas crocea TaxID=3067311 RepID=UPI00296F8F68|nr:hypothetical protein [Muricauda sp. DH64]
MKKIAFAFLLMLAMVQVSQAQEEGKFRVGLEAGYTMPDGGGGVLLAIEPKYNIAANMNVGIRFESASMAKNFGSFETSLSSSVSYSGTFDYYFTSASSSFAPFIGAGAGYHLPGTIGFDNDSYDEELLEADILVDEKFGGLIRAGFEAGKFRLAATYNLVGKSELLEAVEVKNSYLGISVGFYLGGGKWKK